MVTIMPLHLPTDPLAFILVISAALGVIATIAGGIWKTRQYCKEIRQDRRDRIKQAEEWSQQKLDQAERWEKQRLDQDQR